MKKQTNKEKKIQAIKAKERRYWIRNIFWDISFFLAIWYFIGIKWYYILAFIAFYDTFTIWKRGHTYKQKLAKLRA